LGRGGHFDFPFYKAFDHPTHVFELGLEGLPGFALGGKLKMRQLILYPSGQAVAFGAAAKRKNGVPLS